MEPIRPDDDELIADEPFGAAEPRETAPGKQKPVKADKPKQKAEKPVSYTHLTLPTKRIV